MGTKLTPDGILTYLIDEATPPEIVRSLTEYFAERQEDLDKIERLMVQIKLLERDVSAVHFTLAQIKEVLVLVFGHAEAYANYHEFLRSLARRDG